MARKLRVQYPDAIYHVINRGDRREPLFRNDADRLRFLVTLGRSSRQDGLARPRLVSHGQSELMMEERRRLNAPAEWKRIRRGWCLGGERFRQELLEATSPL